MIKKAIFAILILLLFYTRFVNLSWGLPYPFHPDERNMANSIQQLTCNTRSIQDCFNPHFFAYGQFPLYTAYGLIGMSHLLAGQFNSAISFEEAIVALRIISAISSVLTALVLLKIILLIVKIRNTKYEILNTLLIIIFCPFFIQFSHFGTTESLLMLFSSMLVYFSLLFINQKIDISRFIMKTSIVGGWAVATKVSSVIFLVVPFLALVAHSLNQEGKISNLLRAYVNLIKLALFVGLVSFIFSPHNFISFSDFLGSMKYESEVALGSSVFYTRQFFGTLPIFFQFIHIFPYTLGIPLTILFILGFFFLPYTKEINLLRIAFLIFFAPPAFFYAKWTRFVAPAFPVMLLFGVLFLFQMGEFFEKKAPHLGITIIIIITFITVIPGLAFLSVYTTDDVRFEASKWMYNHLPENAYILSETANVVDLPIPIPGYKVPQVNNYHYISFNLYELDEKPELVQELEEHIKKADYIFVPSRRVFANHYCSEYQISNIKYQNDILKFKINKCKQLREKYPLVNHYYDRLFSGELGFEKVAEFSSYPRISFLGKTWEFPDEGAEETWTVFDHPVVRVYKRK